MLTEVEVGPWASEWRMNQEVQAGLQKQNSKINKKSKHQEVAPSWEVCTQVWESGLKS